ncbi:hypothetical protein VHEMI02930 [[Torrubiella] hemipterigena]|nr:hypothetical protein VHEMI02930 [[Torrubiella] hemipterigena]
MGPDLGATFVPGGFDDYYLPEVYAPKPQRNTTQATENMESEVKAELQGDSQPAAPAVTTPAIPELGSNSTPPRISAATLDVIPSSDTDRRLSDAISNLSVDTPSFSPFPKVSGDNIPPGDEAKEEILWNARKNVIHSQDIDAQIAWARDVLSWAEVSAEAITREATNAGKPRASTPRIEHELRIDAISIIEHLAKQSHPDALYLQSKWYEFGKFNHRVDKREAFNGYKKAAESGSKRSEYRMGMLFEQSNDVVRAKEHYFKGIDYNDSAALYRMGMMSLLGQHGEIRDYHAGLERLKAAANTSDEDAPQGAYIYGMLIARDLPDIPVPDDMLTHNVETAKSYIEKAAYQGFAKAQLKMGQAYELCQLGCEFNPSLSLHYYGLASKQGIPEAAMGVSRWFLFGFDGAFKKNEELAYKYAQEAAAAKLSSGEFAVGYYYEIGIHVTKSIPEARKWYQLAADHGNADAPARLESLNQDKTLSKKDHETITLTRIKSQHGSQRGARPERFRQRSDGGFGQGSALPTLSEQPQDQYQQQQRRPVSGSVSPATAASSSPPRPTPAFNIRLDSHNNPLSSGRPASAMPYPDDEPAPLNLTRPQSVVSAVSAPYPDDEAPRPLTQSSTSTFLGAHPGPQADRPGSAFGIKVDHGPGPGNLPHSQSMGNMYPQQQPQPGRGRVTSAGWEPQLRPAGASAGYRQPSPGPPGPQRPASAQYPGGPQQGGPPPPSGRDSLPSANGRLQKPPPNNWQQQQQPLQHHQQQQHSQGPPPQNPAYQGGGGGPDPRMTPGAYDRNSRKPINAPPDRFNSAPVPNNRPTSNLPPRASTGMGPPSQSGRPGQGPGPGRPGPGQPGPGGKMGPATFEDMGIPQGKHEGDCVIM